MKVLIDMPKEVLDHFSELAQKKGWSRKQYMETTLTHHSKISKSKEEARKPAKSK